MISSKNTEDYKFSIGQSIKKIRLDEGLTIADLASKCNINKSGISRLENGHTTCSLTSINKVINALDREIVGLIISDKRKVLE